MVCATYIYIYTTPYPTTPQNHNYTSIFDRCPYVFQHFHPVPQNISHISLRFSTFSPWAPKHFPYVLNELPSNISTMGGTCQIYYRLLRNEQVGNCDVNILIFLTNHLLYVKQTLSLSLSLSLSHSICMSLSL